MYTYIHTYTHYTCTHTYTHTFNTYIHTYIPSKSSSTAQPLHPTVFLYTYIHTYIYTYIPSKSSSTAQPHPKVFLVLPIYVWRIKYFCIHTYIHTYIHTFKVVLHCTTTSSHSIFGTSDLCLTNNITKQVKTCECTYVCIYVGMYVCMYVKRYLIHLNVSKAANKWMTVCMYV